MRYPLIDGQGNFGSVDGDPPAAMRYTEIRMHRLGHEFMRDIEKETVAFQPNYDNTILEPLVLPTRVPNLLLNGSSGIAVGMATNIPPHNLRELCEGLLALLDRARNHGHRSHALHSGTGLSHCRLHLRLWRNQGSLPDGSGYRSRCGPALKWRNPGEEAT